MNATAQPPAAPTAAEPTELLTVPEVATRLGIGLDRLRLVLRRTSNMAGLFRRVGPVRMLHVSRLDEVREILCRPAAK